MDADLCAQEGGERALKGQSDALGFFGDLEGEVEFLGELFVGIGHAQHQADALGVERGAVEKERTGGGMGGWEPPSDREIPFELEALCVERDGAGVEIGLDIGGKRGGGAFGEPLDIVEFLEEACKTPEQRMFLLSELEQEWCFFPRLESASEVAEIAFPEVVVLELDGAQGQRDGGGGGAVGEDGEVFLVDVKLEGFGLCVFSADQSSRERDEDSLFDGALHGSRSVAGLIADRDEMIEQFVVVLDFDLAALEAFALDGLIEHHLCDASERVAFERMEGDQEVDAVDELGSKETLGSIAIMGFETFEGAACEADGVLLFGPKVGGHDHDGVGKVDGGACGVGETAFSEDLE